jgi:hypothetical protein
LAAQQITPLTILGEKDTQRLPSAMAKAGKGIPGQDRRQIRITRTMPADLNHHTATELEPLAIIYRLWPAGFALRLQD